MKTNFWVIGGTLFLTILILGIAFSSTKKTGGLELTKYSNSQDAPKVQLDHTDYDFGKVKLDQKYEHLFTLKNTGTKPLEMTNFRTSCDCTFSEVIIDGATSPLFEMHNSPSWKGTVEPGKEAQIKAIYDPAKMPHTGKVERLIYFETNDPSLPEAFVKFTAFGES